MENTDRIKTNIIELKNLTKTPCDKWIQRFDKDGKIDAHAAFLRYGTEYTFLYRYSNYDLIGWQIENNLFDWDAHSFIVAGFCPQHLDVKKYDWEEQSWAIDTYCPQYSHLNPLNK
jgi:hypothetical protein